jgi:outer membrane protein assembly factor BamB
VGLGLALAVLPLAACVTPIRLGVTPTPGPAPVAVQTLCTDGSESAGCLGKDAPLHRIVLAPSEESTWARVSPDGRTVVMAPTKEGAGKSGVVTQSFVAVDLAQQKELWRIQLSPDGRALSTVCYFAGDRVVFLSLNSLIAVDRATGQMAWRYPAPGDKADDVATATYDAANDLFVTQGIKGTHLVDGATGKQVLTQARLAGGPSTLITGGPILLAENDAYAYDRGLIRIDRAGRKVLWTRKFATQATDDHMGANIGLAVLGALMGGGSSSVPPDYRFARVTAPVLVGDKILVGSLGVVLCLERATGKVLWAQDLAVPEVDQIAVKGDRVYVMAGGRYLSWVGYGNVSVQEPVRHGLYCLSLADGKPVAPFNSPLNANRVARALTAAHLDHLNDDDAWEEEEDWIDEAKGTPKPAPPPAAKAAGPAAEGDPGRAPKVDNWTKTRHVGLALLDSGVLLLTADEVLVLDEATGAVVRRQTLGEIGAAVAAAATRDVVVVRGKAGLMGIDRHTGETRWTQVLRPPGEYPNVHDAGRVPLVRNWSLGPLHLGNLSFWVAEQSGVVFLPADSGRLVALRLLDGSRAWEDEGSGATVLGPAGDRPAVTRALGNTVEVHALPPSI